MIFILFMMIAGFQTANAQAVAGAQQTAHKVVTKEVLQTSMYTYLHVKEGDKTYWLAIPRMDDAKVGETYYHQGGMEMKDFKSKELNRTFASVYFMDNVSRTAELPKPKAMTVPEHGKKSAPAKVSTNIKQPAGAISISELYRDKKKYAGKTVKIKAEVVKYNEKIMGKNWAHIQDGSNFGNDFDLTVTLKSTLKVGDIVTFQGKIALDKDFGSGYFFKVILEDAVIIP